MTTLDYGGDREPMLYAQLGQQPPWRATETSPNRSSGLLSCLSARPPDLADAARTRPRVVARFPSTVVHRLQARGVGARPEVALWAIHRFIRLLSRPAVELPEHMPKQLYFPSQLTVARREAYPERKNAIASLTRAAPPI